MAVRITTLDLGEPGGRAIVSQEYYFGANELPEVARNDLSGWLDRTIDALTNCANARLDKTVSVGDRRLDLDVASPEA